MDFKSKYHGNSVKSAKYAAREAEAKALLLRNLTKLGIQVLEGDPEYVTSTGVIEGHPSVRYDYSLLYQGVFLGYVEVTGDFEKDDYLYILSEKVDRARQLRAPLWVLYRKEKARKWLVIPLRNIVRYGVLRDWIEGERPYYVLHLNFTMRFRNWVLWLRSQAIPAIENGHAHLLRFWVV